MSGVCSTAVSVFMKDPMLTKYCVIERCWQTVAMCRGVKLSSQRSRNRDKSYINSLLKLYALCIPCREGIYNSEIWASGCKACPVSSASPAGSISAGACECNACATATGGGMCSECVPDTYKVNVGSHACSVCETRKYFVQEGVQTSVCLVCPDHSHSNDGSYSRSNCKCNSGYSGADGESCTACIAGKYK